MKFEVRMVSHFSNQAVVGFLISLLLGCYSIVWLMKAFQVSNWPSTTAAIGLGRFIRKSSGERGLYSHLGDTKCLVVCDTLEHLIRESVFSQT